MYKANVVVMQSNSACHAEPCINKEHCFAPPAHFYINATFKQDCHSLAPASRGLMRVAFESPSLWFLSWMISFAGLPSHGLNAGLVVGHQGTDNALGVEYTGDAQAMIGQFEELYRSRFGCARDAFDVDGARAGRGALAG